MVFPKNIFYLKLYPNSSQIDFDCQTVSSKPQLFTNFLIQEDNNKKESFKFPTNDNIKNDIKMYLIPIVIV